jgi:hypothetical protein
MIRSRIGKHLAEHDWFSSLLDLAIVIVGVLVAIQVNNWNEERSHRHAARGYIERIRGDIHQSEFILTHRIAYYAQVRNHALAALAAFDKPKETLGESFVIDAYQSTQILTNLINRSSFDEIMSVGAMSWIPDIAVRNRLTAYYQNVAGVGDVLQYVPPYRENVRRLMPYHVQEAIEAACGDISTQDAHGVNEVRLRENCEPKIDPETVRATVAAITTPDLKLDLVRRIVDLDTKMRNEQALIDRGRALDQFLAQAKF